MGLADSLPRRWAAGPDRLLPADKLEDTPVFRELDTKESEEPTPKTELKDLIIKYWRPMVAKTGLVIALNVATYTLLGYMPTYLETQIGMSNNGSLLLILIGQLTMMVLNPFAGMLSDRTGRKPMALISMGGLLIMAIPLYMLMGTGFMGALIGFGVLGIL